jgi:fermentation-respiration switch protein FrsA (DUF1100 family)
MILEIWREVDWHPQSVELLRANNPSHMVHHIAPTPLLMTVAENDVLCPTDIALETYAQAREPKELHILPGGHFDGYTGANFKVNADRQVEFLRKTLCNEWFDWKIPPRMLID